MIHAVISDSVPDILENVTGFNRAVQDPAAHSAVVKRRTEYQVGGLVEVRTWAKVSHGGVVSDPQIHKVVRLHRCVMIQPLTGIFPWPISRADERIHESVHGVEYIRDPSGELLVDAHKREFVQHADKCCQQRDKHVQRKHALHAVP